MKTAIRYLIFGLLLCTVTAACRLVPCVGSEITSLVWETTGGGEIKFTVLPHGSDYRIHVERYSFVDVDKELALTAENADVLKLVEDIFTKKDNLFWAGRIEIPGVATGTWTNITLICANNKEITYEIGYGTRLQALYNFVDQAMQAAIATPTSTPN